MNTTTSSSSYSALPFTVSEILARVMLNVVNSAAAAAAAEGLPAPTRPNGVPLSAAGIIWAQLGREIVKRVVSSFDSASKSWFDVETAVAAIDAAIVQAVDAQEQGKLEVRGWIRGHQHFADFHGIAETMNGRVRAEGWVDGMESVEIVTLSDIVESYYSLDEAERFVDRFLRVKILREYMRQKGARIVAP